MPTTFGGVQVRAGIVLGGHQPMTRVERRGHRRAQVDIAQAHDQVAGVEDDRRDVLDATPGR